jgi:hypothetical protein
VKALTRSELGLPALNPDLAFNVNAHDAAKTAPAASVLARFKDDVAAYANGSNIEKIMKIDNISDRDVFSYFDGDTGIKMNFMQSFPNSLYFIIEAEKTLNAALLFIRDLKMKLHELRNSDAQVVDFLASIQDFTFCRL